MNVWVDDVCREIAMLTCWNAMQAGILITHELSVGAQAIVRSLPDLPRPELKTLSLKRLELQWHADGILVSLVLDEHGVGATIESLHLTWGLPTETEVAEALASFGGVMRRIDDDRRSREAEMC